MKLKLTSKKLKNLSTDSSLLPKNATPNIAGGINTGFNKCGVPSLNCGIDTMKCLPDPTHLCATVSCGSCACDSIGGDCNTNTCF